MKKINLKYLVAASLLITLTACNQEDFMGKKASSKAPEKIYSTGTKAAIGEWEILVNGATLTKSIDKDNTADAGAQYIVLDLNFKNTSQDGKKIPTGSIVGILNGKEYKYSTPETINLPSWGIPEENVQPLMQKNTKLAYRIPEEKFDTLYFIPDSSINGTKIEITDAKVEVVQQIPVEKPIVVPEKPVVVEKPTVLPSKPETETSVKPTILPEKPSTSGQVTNLPSQPGTKNNMNGFKIGSTVTSNYFNITLHNATISERIANTNLNPSADSLYVIIEATFKNITDTMQTIVPGELVMDYTGNNDYRTSRTELVRGEGWFLEDRVRPGSTKRTKFVYVIPRKEPNYIYYYPGFNTIGTGFTIYDKSVESGKISSGGSSAKQLPTVPAKRTLIYSIDEVYTKLTWLGYRGDGALEKFKSDRGMPSNKAIDESVLRALGMEIKYR